MAIDPQTWLILSIAFYLLMYRPNQISSDGSEMYRLLPFDEEKLPDAAFPQESILDLFICNYLVTLGIH
jgi:hypothetical protein